ncbi:hypothetical protein ACTXT7_002677 [Hymenolepis weldensis]
MALADSSLQFVLCFSVEFARSMCQYPENSGLDDWNINLIRAHIFKPQPPLLLLTLTDVTTIMIYIRQANTSSVQKHLVNFSLDGWAFGADVTKVH